MEWNARPPLQWDWENPTVLNPRIAEHGDMFHSTNFQTKQGINFGSSGDDRTDVPYFEFGQNSPKSSKSVSINSSSIEESRTTKFTLEGFEASLEDLGDKNKFVEGDVANTYATPETSTCSCEPMLSLKLGKQVYFEDSNAGNLTKPSFSMMASRATRKRCQNTLSPHCQVEGCNIDLSSVKDYYRKHRVCESHSKSPKVIIGGLERRFCQQCSRFHGISEFDEKKRSCRRRLSNHNARRRKPQSKVISLNPARMSSWDFESQQIDIFADKLSLIYPRPHANSTWGSTFSSRHSQCSRYVLKPGKACGSTGQQNVPGDEMRCMHAMPYHDSGKLVPFKGAATKVLDAAQDFQRALSLLSTDLRGPCEAKFISPDNANRLGNPNFTNEAGVSKSPINPEIQNLPFASVDLECWCNELQSVESQMQLYHPNTEGSNFFHDFQLFKSPCEIGMYSNQLS